MGLVRAGSSIFRTAALGFAWPLSIIAMILACLVASTGHWKPRAASIYTAIIAGLTIVTLPLLLFSKLLRLGRIGGARCSRTWELILTGLWLSAWVWIANQLNKFSCNGGNTVTTNRIIGSSVGFSLYGHALTPQGAPRAALDMAGLGAHHSPEARMLGVSGRRKYSTRCRCFKALLGFAIPVFTILALDCLSHMWRSGTRDDRSSISSASSASSVSVSVNSPRHTGGAHVGDAAAATEAKV